MTQFFIHRFLEKAKHNVTMSNSTGTKTVTETREQPDTDANFQGNVIPKESMYGTMTKTFTREDPDQDLNLVDGFIPKPNYSLGTHTITKTRESPDTDLNQIRGYIPKE